MALLHATSGRRGRQFTTAARSGHAPSQELAKMAAIAATVELANVAVIATMAMGG
ncbi:MAG: hypothetical protein WAT39_10955 [Planctomycetota bacterium]